MNIVKQLETFRSQMSSREKETTDRILDNLLPLANDSAKEAAKTYKTSTTTLVRLAKRIGLSGYSELSFQTKQFINRASDEDNCNNPDNELKNITDGFNKAVKEIASGDNNDNLKKLAKKIHESQRTFVIGFGYTGLVADYLKYMFLSLGKSLNCFDDVTMVKYVYRVLQSDDLVIIFSASGSIEQYGELYKRCKDISVNLVIITMNSSLNILKQANLSFVLPPVSVISSQFKVQSVDSQPIFWIFASSLARIYQNMFNS